MQETSETMCYLSFAASSAGIVLLMPLLATFTQGMLCGTIKPSNQVLFVYRKIASCPKWHRVEAGIADELGSCLTILVFAAPVHLCMFCSVLVANTYRARSFACRLQNPISKHTRCNARPERTCRRWTALHDGRIQRVQQNGAPAPARQHSAVP